MEDSIKRAPAGLRWHLPSDFARRSPRKRAEIVAWVRQIVIEGRTEYRRYQAEALQERFSLRFPRLVDLMAGAVPPDIGQTRRVAPAALVAEVRDLVRFKTDVLPAIGVQRSGVWSEGTAVQRIERLGLFFGALCAPSDGVIGGLGINRDALSMALLVLPEISDRYLRWREARRGFYTSSECDMLDLIGALTRRDTGWLWQRAGLADRLVPVPGIVEMVDVARIGRDWQASCEAMHRHAKARRREIARIARVHRDPFEPILVVLESESPVGVYRRITTEIIDRLPSVRRQPRARAEAVRAFLMLRFGLHLGVRQRNLRQLLVSARGTPPRHESELVRLRRGELRWSEADAGWQVLIPAEAFKNQRSSFFRGRPFRLLLPDLDGLYEQIDAYLTRHRAQLLGGATDPGTFFVKTANRTTADASFDGHGFYRTWRRTIQRYGIFNPYTGKGAIDGLLPHGPHSVRDVLATHILKMTGSYEQASYAIQDTPAVVAKHYGRFLPGDKAAVAARVLNQVWEAGPACAP